MAELLRLENLCKYYTSAQSVVMGLNGVSLSFRRGEFVAVTGESGSGKSTLAHILGGILPYESGEMFFEGKPTSHFDGSDYEHYRRDHISFISQSYGILPGGTVLQNVVSALRLSGMEKLQALGRAEEILKEVELWELQGRRASKLSSGQKQRLSIARALAKPAPILIADEPTGNLDPENSRKVIDLLARAAKERLVILITHEFSEAEQHATRHIVIQDGRVSMDAALQPENPTGPLLGYARKKQPLSAYVTRLQLSGRPVWSSLVLLFFALTAFAVFAFLGTFIIALDDTPTRLYDNSAFRNGELRRIVAIRSDNASMTQGDYDTILALPYITALERYGYVTDVNYAYREGVDYKKEHTVQDEGSWDAPDLSISSRVYLTEDAGFVRTVPLLAEGKFLTEGRMPQNHREVVMAGGADLIGSQFPVYIYDAKHWGNSSMLAFVVEVVGVTDYGSGLYFHDHIGRLFTHAIAYGGSNRLYLPAEDLGDDQLRCSEYMYSRLLSQGYRRLNCIRGDVDYTESNVNKKENYLTLKLIENPYGMKQDDPAWLAPTHGLYFNNYYEVSPATFEKLTWSFASEQVSLTIADYAYTERVIKSLQAAGYVAISPFREGSTRVDEELAAEREQTLTICLAVLAAVLGLQIVVLRALFGTQTESYKLLSNIGLTCSTAKLSILWQVLLFTVLGQACGFGGLLVCSSFGVERIVHVMRYLPPVYLLVLAVVHLVGALLASAWISHSMARQVFPVASRQSDLPMAEEEAAV